MFIEMLILAVAIINIGLGMFVEVGLLIFIIYTKL